MLTTRVLLLPLLARGMSALAPQCAALDWHWLVSTPSTMDAAKELVRDRGETCGGRPLAVATAHQTDGRGTRGRAWNDDGGGNVAVTIAVPLDAVPLRPLTLLPLRVGVTIATVLRAALGDDRARGVRLKWPNDVLLDGSKVSGVLVEADGTMAYVGIGVNVNSAPDVPASGPDRGRPATSLAAAGATLDAQVLARDLAEALAAWVAGPDDALKLAAAWSALVDWDAPLVIRDTDEKVAPVKLLPDGRLRVRPEAGGPHRDLVAEYLL